MEEAELSDSKALLLITTLHWFQICKYYITISCPTAGSQFISQEMRK